MQSPHSTRRVNTLLAHGPSVCLRAVRPPLAEQGEFESKGAPAHYVYILRPADDSFYVASTQGLDSLLRFITTVGALLTRSKHRPVHLVYSEVFDSETQAVTRERQLKGWSHRKKQALAEGDIQRLRSLSKRRP